MSTEAYCVGIDVGSASTKGVIVNASGGMEAWAIVKSGGNLAGAANRVYKEVLERAGLTAESVSVVVATGYGRESVAFRDKSVTEITCHARGAWALNPETRAVIDIGGQDSKVIALDAGGKVRKFEMNDKCAAGTGRFLEVMAHTMELELSEIGPLALSAEAPAKISSTCTIFAESEVISLLAQGVGVPEILAGPCAAITQRVNGLINRVGIHPELMMTGGVAKNTGVVAHIEGVTGLKVNVPEEPQIVGALGAALIALAQRGLN